LKDGQQVARIEEAAPEPAGSCYRIRDRIDTGLLDAGLYTYLVRWSWTAKRTLEAQESFLVGESGSEVPLAPGRGEPAN
jgi:hypothetical protein